MSRFVFKSRSITYGSPIRENDKELAHLRDSFVRQVRKHVLLCLCATKEAGFRGLEHSKRETSLSSRYSCVLPPLYPPPPLVSVVLRPSCQPSAKRQRVTHSPLPPTPPDPPCPRCCDNFVGQLRESIALLLRSSSFVSRPFCPYFCDHISVTLMTLRQPSARQ